MIDALSKLGTLWFCLAENAPAAPFLPHPLPPALSHCGNDIMTSSLRFFQADSEQGGGLQMYEVQDRRLSVIAGV